jgi:hypothetical protein
MPGIGVIVHAGTTEHFTATVASGGTDTVLLAAVNLQWTARNACAWIELCAC